jgi:hypothetical protein
MANGILFTITNLIYLVPLIVQNFKAAHPDETVLIAAASKAQRNHDEQPVQYGAGWVTARRAPVILTDKRLVCGDWDVPLEKVIYAEMVTYGSGVILKIGDTDKFHYQFGMQWTSAWQEQGVLKIKPSEEKLAMSTFSIVLRVVVFGWLLLTILQQFLNR